MYLQAIYKDGTVYLGDHATLNVSIAVCQDINALHDRFICIDGDNLFICGYVKKADVERWLSTLQHEDAANARAVFRQFRKDTGKSAIPIWRLIREVLDRRTGMFKKTRKTNVRVNTRTDFKTRGGKRVRTRKDD